jgi:hypothetical protein
MYFDCDLKGTMSHSMNDEMKTTRKWTMICIIPKDMLSLGRVLFVVLATSLLLRAHAADTVPKLTDQPSLVAQFEYWRYWPGDHPAIYKFNNNLILAIPPQYQQFWLLDGVAVRDSKRLDQLKDTKILGFSFFLPDFSGYTPKNYSEEFNPSRVDVVSIEPSDPRQAEPDAPGFWPPNMIKRVLKAGIVGEPFHKYGLQCYHTVGVLPYMVTCYGISDARHDENILLQVDLPPYDDYVKFPIMQAVYFTKRYGGLQVIWRTSVDNFSQWQEINAHLWKFIETWNIANQANLPK